MHHARPGAWPGRSMAAATPACRCCRSAFALASGADRRAGMSPGGARALTLAALAIATRKEPAVRGEVDAVLLQARDVGLHRGRHCVRRDPVAQTPPPSCPHSHARAGAGGGRGRRAAASASGKDDQRQRGQGDEKTRSALLAHAEQCLKPAWDHLRA